MAKDLSIEQIQHLAHDYGRTVRIRERMADSGHRQFDEYNDECIRLWKLLIYYGAYADEAHSQLKLEYREHYYSGLEG